MKVKRLSALSYFPNAYLYKIYDINHRPGIN